MIDLSIIIVNYKTRELLRESLISLQNYLPKTFLYEIFVVDNNSGDGTIEMMNEEFPHVEFIANPENFGFARANNKAIKKARGKVLLLLNPDTLLLPNNEFQYILDRFTDDSHLGIVGGRVFDKQLRQVSSYGKDPTPFTLVFHFSLIGKIIARLIPPMRKFRLADYDSASYDSEKNVDHVNGCCFFVRRELSDALEGLNEIYFIYLEETDMCKRARNTNWKVKYIPARTVIHFGQESSKQHRVEMSNHFLQSLRLFYKKHYPNKIKQLEWILSLKIVKPRIKKM
jgi:GT2 family glycosyltransferase